MTHSPNLTEVEQLTQMIQEVELQDMQRKVRGYALMIKQITKEILERPANGQAPGIQAGVCSLVP